MPYIPIRPSLTEDKSIDRGSTDSSSHLPVVKNYISKGGILVVREGVTEMSWSAATADDTLLLLSRMATLADCEVQGAAWYTEATNGSGPASPDTSQYVTTPSSAKFKDSSGALYRPNANLPDAFPGNNGTGTFMAMCWIMFAAGANGTQYMIAKNAAYNQNGYWRLQLRYDGGPEYFRFGWCKTDLSGLVQVTATTPVVNERWYHVAGWRSVASGKTGIRVYDRTLGTVVDNETTPNLVPMSQVNDTGADYDFVIGAENIHGAGYGRFPTDGWIDDVRVYKDMTETTDAGIQDKIDTIRNYYL